MNNDREIIVDKLNGALALYRRERDDYARKKELSEERLRMKKEERVELEKAVRFAEEKLNELLQAAKTTSCTEIVLSLGMPAGGSSGNGTNRKTTKSLDALDAEVEQVRKEASFRHAEMLGKQEKFSMMENNARNQAKVREKALQAAKENTRKLRKEVDSKVSNMNTYPDNKDSMNVQNLELRGKASSTSIKRKIDEMTDEEMSRLSPIVMKRAMLMEKECIALEDFSCDLNTMISEYCRFLGINPNVKDLDF